MTPLFSLYTRVTPAFSAVINASIAAAWIMPVIMLLRLVFKRAPKRFVVVLWDICWLRLAIPFFPKSIFSLIPSAKTVPTDIIRTENIGNTYISVISNPIYERQVNVPLAENTLTSDFSAILGLVWIVGMTVLFFYVLFSRIAMRRRLSASVILYGNVFSCEAYGSPFVAGIIKPRIYIPKTTSPADLCHIIAHEESHIRRGDHIRKPLAFILLCVHWMNPIVWIAYAMLCKDMEMACDEAVISSLSSTRRAEYSQALLNCSVGRKCAANQLAFGKSAVSQRLVNIMKYKKSTPAAIALCTLICIAAALCFLTNPAEASVLDPFTPETFLSDEMLPVGEDRFVLLPEEYSTCEVLVFRTDSGDLRPGKETAARLLDALIGAEASTTQTPAFNDNNHYDTYIALSFKNDENIAVYSLGLCIGVNGTKNCYAVSSRSGLNYAEIENSERLYEIITAISDDAK